MWSLEFRSCGLWKLRDSTRRHTRIQKNFTLLKMFVRDSTTPLWGWRFYLSPVCSPWVCVYWERFWHRGRFRRLCRFSCWRDRRTHQWLGLSPRRSTRTCCGCHWWCRTGASKEGGCSPQSGPPLRWWPPRPPTRAPSLWWPIGLRRGGGKEGHSDFSENQ